MAEKLSGIWSLNLVLLGTTGVGKSASGNTILGRDAFVIKRSSKLVTRDVAVESGSVGGLLVTVYDTPGLSDDKEEEIQQMINEKVLQKCESGCYVFLLVIKADRFTPKVKKSVEKVEELLGVKHLKNTWILFTRGDELEEENMTIEEFINQSDKLNKLVQQFDLRYHVFNNKKKEDTLQVSMLLSKIIDNHHDTMVIGATALKQHSLKRQNLPTRKIVLLGSSGVGKSAAGNTILGQKEFESVTTSNSVTSVCSEAQANVSGRSVSVVDTPGFFHTRMNREELMMEIARSVNKSCAGPHSFLIVFPVNMTFTEQEQQIPRLIERIFGQDVLKYSIILFTHGDLLEGTTVEKLIEENSRLRALVQQCGGRYQLFNNKDLNNREQVNDLLQKIDSMVQQNGRGHHTYQMYEDAQRFRREEEERTPEAELRRLREEVERRLEELRRRREERERILREVESRLEELRIRREERERIQREAEERAKNTCVCS